MTNKEARQVFDRLFTTAKSVDEFEYVCALLRIRGYEDEGWDNLSETHELFRDIMALSAAPLLDLTRVRLGLLLYCHITEAEPIYTVIENMLRVCEGDRVITDPYPDIQDKKTKSRNGLIKGRPQSTSAVVAKLKAHARSLNMSDLAALLDSFFDSSIRNAFFHSDYILFSDEFRSRKSWFLQPNGSYGQTIKLSEVLVKVDQAVSFYSEFIKVLSSHKHSYKASKVVKGRFASDGSVIDVELMADKKRGVYGFKT